MAKVEPLSHTRKAFQFMMKKRELDLQSDYQKEIYFIATIGLSIYYFTALLSFNPLDPSWVAFSYPEIGPKNLAGTIGANLSGWLIFYLGIGAYLIPLPFLSSATLVLTRVDQVKANIRLLGWALAILIAISLAHQYISYLIFEDHPLPSGGAIGSMVSTFLNKTFGEVGSNIILATLSLCSITLILKKGLLGILWRHSFGYLLKPFQSIRWLRKKETLDSDKAVNSAKAMDAAEASVGEVSKNVAAYIPPPTEEPLIHFPQREVKDVKTEDEKNVGSVKDGMFTNLHSLFKKQEASSHSHGQYIPPPSELFNKTDKAKKGNINRQELEKTAAFLVDTLRDFNVEGKVIGYQPGPVVTVYEFQPNTGIKQSKIMGLIDDLALALRVDSIFINPVKGKRALGIQVPNEKREVVFLGDIIDSPEFQETDKPLTFALGKSLSGDPVCADLAGTPHLLVAGATGSGKSVGINSLLCSILMKASPESVRMILVDPKMLELSVYDGIPHLLMPVITEAAKANLALKWAVNEMERRYKLMQQAKVRNIEAFNAFWDRMSGKEQEEFKEQLEDGDITRLPYILLVIDELADLMLSAPKEIESIIQRLAQKARASGIHMVLATQRPSVDIITGVIKANLPTRIAFQVVSKHDSRTILDMNGADKLLGKGDMLFQRPGKSQLERIQGTLITDDEVNNLVASIKAHASESYDDSVINWIEEEANKVENEGSLQSDDIDGEEDPKYDEAFVLAQRQGTVSASFLQRNLKIGYNRAARIVETMERLNLVAKADGSKPRKWLGPNSIDQQS